MLGVGIDIVENKRIKQALSDAFLSRVLANDELNLLKDFKEKRLVEFVAGRFASKEAIIKCLSDYELPSMNELNIKNDEKGKPYIEYKNYDILLSLSHEDNYSVAVAYLNGVR